jgi:menaquinone-dependent protoporphyrinogen oxidase
MSAHESGPSRSLVVAAASRHGSTGEIADRLAEVLTLDLGDSWQVERVELNDLRHLDGTDAVVLGSAIYFGHWMRPAAKALEYLREAPPSDLWLFSTGPVSEIESENEQIISADATAELGEADEHMVFGGNIDPSRLSLGERLVVKAVHALSGDHRNWDDVDRWAHHIASELGAPALRETASGTKGPTDQGMSL